MTASSTQRTTAVLTAAAEDGTTPGAVAQFGVLDDAPQTVVVGSHGLDGWARPVTRDTIYDLASLTKLFSTTVLAAHAVSEGAIALSETPWAAWPDVTVAHVMAHRAGLPAWLPMYLDAQAKRVVGTRDGREAILHHVRRVIPDDGPDAITRYSDVGFIALGAFLEERLGASLDDLFRAHVAPFTTHPLGFVPLIDDGFIRMLSTVAPTERCPWRGRVMHGQVHDENAFAMGGVAGHAGLFGTIDGCGDVARVILRALASRESSSSLSPSSSSPSPVSAAHAVALTLRSFATATSERPLGFDRVTPDGSTGGVLSSSSVGHLGFTGTSVWLDPDAARGPSYFVLLTNRVHPTRDNARIKELRPAFHRAAVADLDGE